MKVMKIFWFDNTDLCTIGAGQVTKTLTILNGLGKYTNVTLITRCSQPKNLRVNVKKTILLKPVRDPISNLFPLDVFMTSFRNIRKASYDLVVFSHPYQSLPLLLLSKAHGLPVVYDCHGIELVLSRDWYVFFIEKSCMMLSDFIIVMSEADKKDVQRLYGVKENRIFIIPPPKLNDPCSEGERRRARESLAKMFGKDLMYRSIVIFHGSLDYEPNYEALNIILNHIAPEVSEAVFVIIGKSPPFKGRRGNVIFTGQVDDIRRFLCAADIAIVPLVRVTGVNFKVLDYIKLGIPMIISPVVLRWLNLDEIEGDVVVSDVKSMANALKQVLMKGVSCSPRWKIERKVEDVINDYLKAFMMIIREGSSHDN